jgi:Fe-S cluster biosynthesis and repair protein YggX
MLFERILFERILFERTFKVGLHSKEQLFLPKSDLKNRPTNFGRTLFDQMSYPAYAGWFYSKIVFVNKKKIITVILETYIAICGANCNNY